MVGIVRGAAAAGGDATLAEWGCRALATLVNSHPANLAAAGAAGGVEAVTAALAAHPGAEKVQERGCLALSNLVARHPHVPRDVDWQKG